MKRRKKINNYFYDLPDDIIIYIFNLIPRFRIRNNGLVYIF